MSSSPVWYMSGELEVGKERLLTISRVQINLLNAPRPRALNSHSSRLSREELLVLQIGHLDLHWLVHQTVELDFERIFVDFWYAAVVADEVVFVVRDFCLDQFALFNGVSK